MAEIGRLTAVFDADTRKFDAGVRGVAAKVTGLSNTLSGLTGNTTSAASTLSTLTSPMALVAGGGVVLAGVLGTVGAGLLSLVKHTADVAGGLKDLSDQTNFSVETLSTLDVAAKRSGSTLQGLSSSLIIFQKNQGAAASGNKEMGKAFQSLGIDIHNNELGLRQAFTALAKLGTTQDATAKGAKIFGRGIKDVQGVIKETNGDIDAAMAKYSQWGGVISTETAMAADQFSDTLQTLTDQIDASSRALLSDSLPVFTSFLEQISAALTGNAGSWQQWSGVIASEVAIALGSVRGFVYYVESLGTIPLNVAINMGIGDTMSEAGKSIAINRAMAATERAARIASGPSRGGGGGGGGGGRGGGGVDPAIALLKQLNKEMFNLTDHTRLQEIQEQLLGKEFAKTNDTMKKKAMIIATEIDITKKILAVTRERYATEASYARFAEEEFIKTLTRVRALSQVERDRFVTGAGRNRPSWIDLGGGSTVGGEPGTTGRPRIATVDMQVMRERVAMMREQMNTLAGDLTSIFSRSIGDGFNQGIKSGLLTLGQGLLQIVEQVFLKRLAEGLSQMLGNLTTGGGGGGFWGGLFKAVLGGAVSGIGGSINLGGGSSYTPGGTGATRPRIVGRSSGGPLDPGNIYQVHKDEIIIPTSSGFVLPKGMGGETVVHNHFSINLPPAPKGSYVSPKSARQQADLVMAALRGAQ